ncbi:MAG: polysaccharide deacetylase family protein, partial [Candidatus Marinimicrobia bacterium]|nr:polysaccharide deacetylase family protein [Candidatus Neomarinimicrobiota bacterium]
MKEIPILVYHKISPQFEAGLTTISPKSFKKQMSFLKQKGYIGCSLKNYLQDPQKNKFVITFDDAYENIYHYALPILKELGFTASIFVIVNFIGKYNTWDANIFGIKFKHAKQSQLQEMIDSNWEICSHSFSHKALINLTNEQIINEVKNSKIELEKMFNITIDGFGFPFGYYNKEIIKILKKYDYKNGVGFTMNFKQDIPIYRRMGVYKFVDWKRSVYFKINKQHPLNIFEILKGKIIHSGSYLTILYQKI